jgi:translocator protein
MKKLTTRQTVTIVITLLTIVLNVLANALPFNGQGTGEISDRFEVLFVPAGYVFSIWSLIYIGLIAFTVFQAKSNQANNPLLDRIAPFYWVANMANNVWLFFWHWELFPLTLLAMLIILVSLVYLYLQFRNNPEPLSPAEKRNVKLPFSLYLGWISVATIANVSQVLYFIGWDGFGLAPEMWTVIMLLVATILGLLMLLREWDIAFGLVLVWAFIGIALKQSAYLVVVRTAWLGSGLIVLMTILTIFRIIKLKKEK